MNNQLMKIRNIFLPLGLLLLTLAVPASGQNSLESCADISDSAARLACYDGVMENRNPENLPVVRLPRSSARDADLGSEQTKATTEPTTDNSQDNFGIEHKAAGRDGADERTMTVASARHTDLAGWIIEFDNGQTWKQVGTDSYDIEEGKSYKITRGFMTSFILSNFENNRKIRVTRVK